MLVALKALAEKIDAQAEQTRKPGTVLYEASAYAAFRWDAQDLRSLIDQAEAK